TSRQQYNTMDCNTKRFSFAEWAVIEPLISGPHRGSPAHRENVVSCEDPEHDFLESRGGIDWRLLHNALPPRSKIIAGLLVVRNGRFGMKRGAVACGRPWSATHREDDTAMLDTAIWRSLLTGRLRSWRRQKAVNAK